MAVLCNIRITPFVAAVGMLLTLLLAVSAPSAARTAVLAWDYEATRPPEHKGFVVRGCPVEYEGCAMRNLQRLGPQERQVDVALSDSKVRCFAVVALLPRGRSAPSNFLCLSP